LEDLAYWIGIQNLRMFLPDFIGLESEFFRKSHDIVDLMLWIS